MYIYIERYIEGLRVIHTLSSILSKPLLKVMFWYVLRRTKTRALLASLTFRHPR